MIIESEPVEKLVLISDIIILHIIIVDMFPDCVIHEINGVKENTKYNIISRIS